MKTILKINLKVQIIEALVKYEHNKGRTNISKCSMQNFAYYANRLINNR